MMEEYRIAALARMKGQYDKSILITYREFHLLKADRCFYAPIY